jgi:sigma-E factor negative regulatory protein RseA
MNRLNAVHTPETDVDEWISALLDGELDAEESKRGLARIGKEADAARLWSEYHLIGDVLRGCEVGNGDFGARFRAALEAEPTVLAPMPAAPDARRPYYWMAAAAAVTAITWSVLSLSPHTGSNPAVPVAANSEPAMVAAVSGNEVQAYLAAHQDYAYAVVGEPEMHYTKVSAVGESR